MGEIRRRLRECLEVGLRWGALTNVVSGLCLGVLTAGFVAGLAVGSDDITALVTPIAIGIAVLLLARQRVLEIILIAVTFHLVSTLFNAEQAGTRDLDVVITGVSAVVGLLAARRTRWLKPRTMIGGGVGDGGPVLIASASLPSQPARMTADVGAAPDVSGHTYPAGSSAPPQTRFGDSGLSLRQLEVVQLVLRGLTARQIGSRLFISERTVETHLAHVYERLGVHSRLELLESMSQPAVA